MLEYDVLNTLVRPGIIGRMQFCSAQYPQAVAINISKQWNLIRSDTGDVDYDQSSSKYMLLESRPCKVDWIHLILCRLFVKALKQQTI